MGVELRGEDVGALAERTEGWIAGFQLAGLSLQGGPTRLRQFAASPAATGTCSTT